jgi:hypothetical protein
MGSYIFRPHLIQRKFIWILEDFIPIGIFPTKPFELKEWTLWNPIKFLWNASSHTSFGGILTRGRTSWKNRLSLYLSSNSCVFPVVQSNSHSYVIPVFCNHLFYTYIPVRILCFSYSSVFLFMWFKGALSFFLLFCSLFNVPIGPIQSVLPFICTFSYSLISTKKI